MRRVHLVGFFMSVLDVAFCFIAYECGGVESNYTSVSLVNVGECNFEPVLLDESEITIQLLQPRARASVNARACKVEVNYVVYYCGMHSHNSIVKGGIVSKVLSISKSQCEDMHRERSASFYGTRVSGLEMNDTVTTPVNFAGWTSWDGACDGAEFVDGGHNWGKVVATGTIKVSLYEFQGSINLEDREIRFPSGSVCSLDSARCVDNDHGPTFWDAYTSSDCQRDSFHVLYRGLATRARVQGKRNDADPVVVYSVTTGQNVFTLTSDNLKPFCFMQLRGTNHPKLFIHEVEGDNFYFTQEEVSPLDMDMFMYVNTKFLHLERSLSSQMSSMYREIVQHRCELDRKILMTKLSMAVSSPMEFAFEHMRGPGYTASILGEVIYIVQCTPVDVATAKTSECTLEMPVLYKNETYYMRPRSRVLQRSATPAPCDGVLVPKYRINGVWFATTPSLHVSSAPELLEPDNRQNWTYTSAGDFATAGIYTSEQIDKLREQIMAPIERRTKGERFSSLLNSERVNSHGLDLSSFTGEAIIQEKMQKLWEKTWNVATIFGNVSAGLIGIAMILKLCKFAVDTFVHAITLKEVYGCTWYVLGSVWDALTTYLLTRAPTSSASSRDEAKFARESLLRPSNEASNIYELATQPRAQASAPISCREDTRTNGIYPSVPEYASAHVAERTLKGVVIN